MALTSFDRSLILPPHLNEREALMWTFCKQEDEARRSYLEDERNKLGRSWVYSTIGDILLKHGEFYIPQERPRRYGSGVVAQCYLNSGKLALSSQRPGKERRGRLEYVEGYALWHDLPIHHGWCVDEDGRVVDVTWRYKSQEVPHMVYFGVRFNAHTWDRARLMTGQTSILDDWQNGFPVMQVPFDHGEGPGFLEAVERGIRDRAKMRARNKELLEEALKWE